jgi:hypothetical protein
MLGELILLSSFIFTDPEVANGDKMITEDSQKVTIGLRTGTRKGVRINAQNSEPINATSDLQTKYKTGTRRGIRI